jgi:hypothetical protein
MMGMLGRQGRSLVSSTERKINSAGDFVQICLGVYVDFGKNKQHKLSYVKKHLRAKLYKAALDPNQLCYLKIEFDYELSRYEFFNLLF